MSYSKTGLNSRCRKHGTHPLKYCSDRAADEAAAAVKAREQAIEILRKVALQRGEVVDAPSATMTPTAVNPLPDGA